jgi:UDP-glucose 4-epimerase
VLGISARTIDEHDVTAVMHLAGLKYAGVSVRKPLLFFRQNVTGMQVLLEAVRERGIERFVFSSSASWYGTPDVEIVNEDAPANPQSLYGQTKVASEWLLRDVATAWNELRQTSLRYFNVVGSGPRHLVDRSPHNLFPKAFTALTAGQRPIVNGTDYPTPDGSCLRDYVHVADLADAHIVAAQRLDAALPAPRPTTSVGARERACWRCWPRCAGSPGST